MRIPRETIKTLTQTDHLWTWAMESAGIACPACDGKLLMRGCKLLCSKCHRVVETCSDGGEA